MKLSTLRRQLCAAIRMLITITCITAIIYPAIIWLFAITIFRYQAQGSLTAYGSELIGQDFTEGNPANPQNRWFIGRPSASNYDGLHSGGINLGPNSKQLLSLIQKRQKEIIIREQTAIDKIPSDAVTTSASGLDPFISFEYAQLQALRVARVNHLSFDRVENFISANTQGRDWGFLGVPRVNVVTLNIQLKNWITRH